MYVHGIIDSVTHTRLSNWCQTAEAKGYARKLFHDGTVDMAEYLLRLQLIKLREMDGEGFDHTQVIFISERRDPRQDASLGIALSLRFLGHFGGIFAKSWIHTTLS
jgi:hypothetical protein